MPTLQEIADALDEIAIWLELAGDNPFKTRAYVNAARLLRGVDVAPEEFLAEVRAGRVKGVGKGLAEKLDELFATGRSELLEELRAKFPPSLLELFEVPGLGAKKVKILYDELGIDDLTELEDACRDNHLAQLPGFGVKTQENILEGIARIREHHGRFLMSTARRAAARLLDQLRATGLATRLEIGGSVRRCRETVKDIDLLAVSSQPDDLMAAFVAGPDVKDVTGHDGTKSSVVLAEGIAVDLRVVAEEQFAAALVHFTGSKEHNTMLRGLAKTAGRKLSEYGLFDGETPLPLADEAALYREFGLHFIPPELREGTDEIERARRAPFPALVTEADIHGVFHAHTTYSDGRLTLPKLAAAVRDRGYEYLGVTDHSQTAAYAGGLKEDDIKRQHEEIDQLNEELAPFRIFKGIESDILADGSLDYPDRVLARFDFVIASVHGQFRMSEGEMTRRVVNAVANPYTTILGHPTGRLLLGRAPYAIDLPAVLEAAAAHGVMVEINANPHRLDLDWRFHRRAVELGVLIPICPDAHNAEGIADIAYGVGIARKGGLTAESVPTCWKAARLADHFARRKS